MRVYGGHASRDGRGCRRERRRQDPLPEVGRGRLLRRRARERLHHAYQRCDFGSAVGTLTKMGLERRPLLYVEDS